MARSWGLSRRPARARRPEMLPSVASRRFEKWLTTFRDNSERLWTIRERLRNRQSREDDFDKYGTQPILGTCDGDGGQGDFEVHVERAARDRIISARPATSAERDVYETGGNP